MNKVEYKVSFDRNSLRLDIANCLKPIVKGMTLGERCNIADKVVDALFELGDYAVYHGMVKYGAKLAVSRFVVHDES